jgi:hypothetical protein
MKENDCLDFKRNEDDFDAYELIESFRVTPANAPPDYKRTPEEEMSVLKNLSEALRKIK